MAEGPIFIGGPDRCGKTMLAAILGSHSRIAIPIVGSNLWTFFYGQYGDLNDDANFDRCLAALMRYKHALFLKPEVPRLRAELPRDGRSYAGLFERIHAHFAERAGKPRWGDQTGLIERYADQVLGSYPGAVMLHMVRDPRDRYEASLKLWPDGRARAGGAAARWAYSVRLGERNLRRHPDRYRMVRYEDLVSDPERTVRGLLELLGEAYEPPMLLMGDAPTYRRRLAGGEEPAPDRTLISDEHIGDYENGRVPQLELAFLERALAGPMGRLGYGGRTPTTGLRARAIYLFGTRPLNSARMAAWMSLEALQHRFPRLMGRNPVRAKVVDTSASGS
ncbi:MAG: sulfotransferase family protein [Candidatus Limnocylindria bacterium]